MTLDGYSFSADAAVEEEAVVFTTSDGTTAPTLTSLKPKLGSLEVCPLYLPTSPYISLHAPTSPYISPRPPYIALDLPISPLYLPVSPSGGHAHRRDGVAPRARR